ncbi:unnamed protein product, partial [marine sediment metagenome]
MGIAFHTSQLPQAHNDAMAFLIEYVWLRLQDWAMLWLEMLKRHTLEHFKKG